MLVFAVLEACLVVVSRATVVSVAAKPVCPGSINVTGLGTTQLRNAVWDVPEKKASDVEVVADQSIAPSLGGRTYFTHNCLGTEGEPLEYMSMKLLGKRIQYTTDLSGAGCGCNAALYLVAMAQNTELSGCGDYYCDANSVCGVKCTEIDLQEANMHAWHSTVHGEEDKIGVGAGFGGGGTGESGWSGPRDWTAEEYGPSGRCIETRRPFQVEVGFPADATGLLRAVEVKLTQEGKTCPLHISLGGNYEARSEISTWLLRGLTPVISYWRSDDMLWMDGSGEDGNGPCSADKPETCASTVRFVNFSVEPIPGEQAPEIFLGTPLVKIKKKKMESVVMKTEVLQDTPVEPLGTPRARITAAVWPFGASASLSLLFAAAVVLAVAQSRRGSSSGRPWLRVSEGCRAVSPAGAAGDAGE